MKSQRTDPFLKGRKVLGSEEDYGEKVRKNLKTRMLLLLVALETQQRLAAPLKLYLNGTQFIILDV